MGRKSHQLRVGVFPARDQHPDVGRRHRRRCDARRGSGRACLARHPALPGRPADMRNNSSTSSQAWPPTIRHDQDGEGRASGSGRSGAVNGETGQVPRLVVGISRSRASWWALAWAVGEARRRRARLLLAHVFRPPVAPATAAYGEAASACPGTRTPTAGITPEGSRMSANGGQRRGFGPYRASSRPDNRDLHAMTGSRS